MCAAAVVESNLSVCKLRIVNCELWLRFKVFDKKNWKNKNCQRNGVIWLQTYFQAPLCRLGPRTQNSPTKCSNLSIVFVKVKFWGWRITFRRPCSSSSSSGSRRRRTWTTPDKRTWLSSSTSRTSAPRTATRKRFVCTFVHCLFICFRYWFCWR